MKKKRMNARKLMKKDAWKRKKMRRLKTGISELDGKEKRRRWRIMWQKR